MRVWLKVCLVAGWVLLGCGSQADLLVPAWQLPGDRSPWELVRQEAAIVTPDLNWEEIVSLRPEREDVAYRTVHHPGRPEIRGHLPRGWTDNSTWAQVATEYERKTDEDGVFLRWTTGEVQSGAAQLRTVLPTLPAGRVYRLSMRSRSASGGTIMLALRQNPSPYQHHWRAWHTPGQEWSTVEYYLPVRETLRDVGLYLRSSSPMEVDISEITLASAATAPLGKDASMGNLLHQTRLPLGIPAHWTPDRNRCDEEDYTLTTDHDMRGLSGSPVLRVVAKEPMWINLESYALPPGSLGTYTFSVSIRGYFRGHLRLRQDNRVVASLPLLNRPQWGWQRHSLTFQQSESGTVLFPQIEGRGDFRLDALQLETGANATAYASALPLEVALAGIEPTGFSFVDAPWQVALALTGANPPAKGFWQARLTHVDGSMRETSRLPLVDLGSGDGSPLRLVLPPEWEEKLGSFLLEVRFMAEDGTPLAPVGELALHRLPTPHHWGKDAPESPFGVHTLAVSRHLRLAKAMGFNWVRLHDAGTEYIGWYHLEPRPGRWRFQDEVLERYRTHHLQILGAFSTAPGWATALQRVGPQRAYADRYYVPENWEAFARYVRTVTARYRHKIRHWDVWNEPWALTWWHDDWRPETGYVAPENPEALYAHMMAVAHRAAHAVSPDVQVLGFNTLGSRPRGENWTRGVFEAGGWEHTDILSYHHYTYGANGYPGDEVETHLAQAFRPIREAKGPLNRPIWMTEGSASAFQLGEGMARHRRIQPKEENHLQLAVHHVRYVSSLLAHGVERIFLYSMHTHQFAGMETNYRGLVTDTGQLHPVGAVQAVLARFLEGKQAEGIEDIPGKGRLLAFSGDRETLTLWLPYPGQSGTVPEKIGETAKAFDVWGNPWQAGSQDNPPLLYFLKAKSQ